MTDIAVSAENIHKAYKSYRAQQETIVLRDVSLTVAAGGMVAIVGPSGAGKSTLLYCLAGLERPESGRATILGIEVSTLKPGQVAKAHRGRVGFVFQTLNLVPSLSARENVLLPSRLARIDTDSQRADATLEEMGLASRTHHATSKLSLGEQQRVALARIIYSRPPVVFADEPTGSLDSAAGAVVLDRLRTMTDAGQTVIMVTHDLDAASTADTVVVLRDGQVAACLVSPRPDQIWSAMHESQPTGGI